MVKNKIYIDNFLDIAQRLGLENQTTHKKTEMLVGLHSQIDKSAYKKHVVSEIFKALLLHDIIAINTSELDDFINIFGIKDTLKLFQTGKFEFIDDQGMHITLTKSSPTKYFLDQIFHAGENGTTISSLERLESSLYKNNNKHNIDIKTLLLNIEKYNKVIPIDDICLKIENEILYDIKNSNVSNYLNLHSYQLKEIEQKDAYNILRLSKMNKTLIYSSSINADNISMDGIVKQILSIKIPPALKTPPSNLFDAVFKDIFEKKGIPDLSDLYIKKTITIDDYIEIVSTFGAKKFRNWLMEKNYNIAEIESDILKLNPKITNQFVKFIRWIVPNVLGIVFPTTGLITSLGDSYIVEKLINGWHPNLFLDEVLKQNLDNKIANYNRDLKLESIKTKFPNISRNDQCPCGSQKKFKHCCGK